MRDMDTRAALDEGVVGDRKGANHNRPAPPDECADAGLDRSDLTVGRGAPFREDEQDVAVADDLHECPEVPGSLRCPGAPELVETVAVVGRERPPQEVGVLAAENVTGPRRGCGAGPLGERSGVLLRQEIGERPVGVGGEHLPHPRDLRAPDGEDVDDR